MCPELIIGDSARLRFSEHRGGLRCEVEIPDSGSGTRYLNCRLGSLTDVLRGLRYHFAGENVLCTIHKEGETVFLDLQASDLPSMALQISETQYSDLLRQLGARI